MDNSDSDFEPRPAKRTLPARTATKRRISSTSSDDSDDDVENPPVKRKPGKSNPKAATSSTAATTAKNEKDDGFRATIRTTEKNVTFLGHTMKKTRTLLICPYRDAKGKFENEFTTFTALQKHF